MSEESAGTAKDSLQAMQWMRYAVMNRLKFGAQHFGAAKNATTMTEAIKGACRPLLRVASLMQTRYARPSQLRWAIWAAPVDCPNLVEPCPFQYGERYGAGPSDASVMSF